MGYISSVEGTINITDTVSRKLFSKSFVEDAAKNRVKLPEYRLDGADVFEDMKNVFDKDDELHWIIAVTNTDEGYQLVYSESGKAHSIAENVQKILDYFKKQGFEVSGEIRLIGEESPDFRRVIVRDGVAVLEKAIVTVKFADGSTWG